MLYSVQSQASLALIRSQRSGMSSRSMRGSKPIDRYSPMAGRRQSSVYSTTHHVGVALFNQTADDLGADD